MRFAARLEAGLAAVILCGFLPSRLLAQSRDDAGSGSRAIEVGNEGIALYEQQRWNDALERFRQADALYHSPVFVLYTARVLQNSGRLLEARESFHALVNERLEASAPEQWQAAQRDGAVELGELEAKIPSVRVTVTGASASVRLAIDGRSAPLDESVELDPGRHQAVVADGSRRREQDFVAVAGRRDVTLLVELSPAAAVPSERQAVRDAGHEPRSPPSALRVTGFVATGVGGAALIAGGVVGVMALNKKSHLVDSLPASCSETTCPPSAQANVEARTEEVQDLAKAADVLFIGGATVAALGLALVVFAPPEVAKRDAAVSVRAGFCRADVRFRF
jgi:hypothetical protein